jgi:tungstate transport system ATP-binding protein
VKLQLDRIGKAAGGRMVLDGVSASLEKGDFCALIGPTGCGKTTLLRIVDLLEKPSSGRVLLDGTECTRSRGRERTVLRRRMSMVMQRPFMLAGTVERNVGFGLSVRGVKPAGNVIADALEAVGLPGMAGRNARTLSGGEMQKVAIARAVITRPELLLLDEPLNSVDQGFKPELRTLIGRLHRDLGITVLMATHDLADALALSSRTVVMSGGRVMQAGGTPEVFNNPSSLFVASFIGLKNIFPAKFRGEEALVGDLAVTMVGRESGRGYICVPQEVITLSPRRPESSQRNTFEGEIVQVAHMPLHDEIHVKTGGLVFLSSVTRESTAGLGLTPGARVWVSFKATSVRILSRNSL